MIEEMIREHGAPFVLGCTITAPAVWAFLNQTILSQVRATLALTEKRLNSCREELKEERKAHIDTLRKLGGL